MVRKQTAALLLAALFLGPSGCASYQPGAIQVGAIDEYPYRTAREGISLAADPYDSKEKAERGFYVDLNSQRFYPINLILKNDTNDPIIVLRETIELIDASGNVHRPIRGSIMYNAFEKSKIAYALLGFGIFSYMSADEANRKMEADWREKEIPDQLTILSGRRANGFAYFQLPEGKIPKGGKLRVGIEKLDTKKQIQLELAL